MKKKWKSGVSLFMAAALVAGNISIAEPLKVEAAEGKTYYIDPAGNDSNNGLSESAAWSSFANLKNLKLTAGDKVLLKAGASWNDEKLEITGAEGTAEQPVILGRYGNGANPKINGNGSKWLDGEDRSALKKEDVAAVHVKNSKYITIQNLEVTNREEDSADLMGEVNDPDFDQSKYMLTGILVENNDAGDLPGVVVKDNYVHDVNGYMSQNGKEGDKKGSGGIMVLVTGGTTPSYYTDLKITGNEVDNVCHEAIYMESCWAARTLVGGANSQQAGKEEWVGWPNVYVAHNYVHDVAGDGIVLINADGGVAEYNLVTGSADERWDYSRNPAHAAIWMWDCNNVTMQYNEASYTESTQDGMAFDCDYGNQNVMYQYNYSHDNKGGFWMACPGPYYTVNSVVRYNVSINDGGFDGGRIIRVGEKGSIGHQFYNNTMYWDTGEDAYEIHAVEQGSWGTPPTSGTDIYNNIFYGNAKENIEGEIFVNNDGIHYDSNCVWGNVKDAYPIKEDKNAVIADPSFADVEGEVYTDGEFTKPTPETEGKVVLGIPAGFKLNEDSPCINAGQDYLPVPEESLSAVAKELRDTQIKLENKDYDGNPVPYITGNPETEHVDIGAFEYQGNGPKSPYPSPDKIYLKALVDKTAAYKAEDFLPENWKRFEKAYNYAKTELERTAATQNNVDIAVAALEEALVDLAVKDGTPADDILASYNSGDTANDNSGFEKDKSGWGTWQSTVEISSDKAHNGNKSLKVTQTDSSQTAYSELGSIPVAANTTYVLEAWVNAGEADITKVGLEAKHHESVTSDKKNHKLNEMSLAATSQPDANGWHKAVMEFTTEEYETISVSISSNTATVYVDDVIIYPKKVKADSTEGLDKTSVEEALALRLQYDESYYTKKSWENYQSKVAAAKIELVNPFATQETLNQAAVDLTTAYDALVVGKTNKHVLQSTYDACKARKQENYTDTSWKRFQDAITAAKKVLDKKDATQKEINDALTNLKDARNALTIKGTVTTPPTKIYKNALQSMYKTWEPKTKNQGNYTDTSWQNLCTAVRAAKTVLDNKKATQDQIDTALENLENARDALATKKAQTIQYTKNYTKMIEEKTFNLNAKVTTGDGKLSYKSSSTKVATVDEKGKVTLKGTGNCNITITASATGSYNKKSVTVSLTVKKKQTQSIKYTKSYTKAFGAKAFSLGAKRTKGNGPLSYKTSNRNIATVDNKGKVTIKGTGICTITITAKATSTYNAKSVTVTLTVKPKKATIGKLTLVKGKKLKVAWTKDTRATGYEVQCALKKDFKKIAKKVTISKVKTTNTTFTKLTTGKKYYVRVRAYKNVKVSGKNKKLTGAWSTVKLSGKIKK